ncbi:tail fiber protein [Flagellimonas hadalis]|uniref:BZIP transcription factor n=1 Tax=Flagellimonas hadalis TaxID=2597517 RepID=A0A5N5IJR6_9FLAO|nr:tail fiber protein [Allomuricauda hadalis]KAB5483124.1 hypothetical protein FOT42_017765 [Allomuricauda hadalis]
MRIGMIFLMFCLSNMLLAQTNTFPSSGNVGIGTVSPISKVHLYKGFSGGSPHSFSDLTVEDNENGMVSILTPNTAIGYFGFSDSEDDYVGGMHYEHDIDRMVFRVNNYTNNLIIDSAGNVSLGPNSTNSPNSQLVITNNFGANISGSSGGNAIFGSNMSVVQGGENHNQLITPSTHASYGYSGVRSSWGKLYFYTQFGNTTAGEIISGAPRMLIDHYGNVGIGTTNPGTYKLAVKGKIRAEEIKVETGWADYVFKEGYTLPTLKEVERHIKEKGHLINIPSAKQVEENGIELGEMNKLLLEKIEELTLYLIQQRNETEEIKKELLQLKQTLKK